MYYLKTQNGLKAQIAIACDKGFAGYIEISSDRWIDCKWDINGRCLIENEFGSFYHPIIPEKCI